MFHDILICDDIDVNLTTCIVKYTFFALLVLKSYNVSVMENTLSSLTKYIYVDMNSEIWAESEKSLFYMFIHLMIVTVTHFEIEN